MQRQEVLATRLLPITPIAQSHLDVVVSRILHDVRRVLQVHMETSQQSLQFRVSHVREGTAVTLLARRPRLDEDAAWMGRKRHSPSLLSVHVPDVVCVLLIELVDGDLPRELVLEEFQTSLHAQADAAQEASQLLAPVVEEMARVAESLVHGHHAERETSPAQCMGRYSGLHSETGLQDIQIWNLAEKQQDFQC